MSYFERCPLNMDNICEHCVKDGDRIICMHRKAKVNKEGFSLVKIQSKCPLKKEIKSKKMYDKYGRKHAIH